VIELGGLSLAEPQWIDNENIVFIGYEEGTRRLGIIYCMNRSSRLYKCNIASEPECIAGQAGNVTIRCPRVSQNGKRLAVLVNSAGGPHAKASNIVIYSLDQEFRANMVPFHGDAYVDGLANRCWAGDERLILCVVKKQQKVLLVVDAASQDIALLPNPKPFTNLIDFDGKVAVVSGSAIDSQPAVFVSPVNLKDQLNWIPVTPVLEKEPVTYENQIIKSGDGKTIIGTILISPAGREKEASACFVVIHGGPHACVTDGYYVTAVMFAKLGFKTLIINYRGSTGFDEHFVNALPGNVGTADVQDCIAAVDHYVSAGVIDKSRLVLWGGSHGGFLITHLSGQHPEYDWLSVITRNPVIDLTSLIELSDIPDWTAVEALGPKTVYDEKKLIDVNVLFDKSPYKFIDKVKAPTLMLLGSEDKRVPMSQGKKWYRGLKARGVETQCHVYADKHDLYKVEVDSDVFVNAMIWVLSRLGPDGARK
jgi:acylaminoacyl-peptidase